MRAGHGGLHAPDILAVNKHFHRDGIGAGDQMPERQGVGIGLPGSQRDDFELGDCIILFKAKGDRHRRGLGGTGRAPTRPQITTDMVDDEDLGPEQVGEIKNINRGEHNCGKNENPVFFGHKIFESDGRVVHRIHQDVTAS